MLNTAVAKSADALRLSPGFRQDAQQQEQQQQQQKQLKFSSNVFNFYRKNVAPKLGDFGSFARDMMNDKPPVVTNENEESDVDYDDIRSSGDNVRGSW